MPDNVLGGSTKRCSPTDFTMHPGFPYIAAVVIWRGLDLFALRDLNRQQMTFPVSSAERYLTLIDLFTLATLALSVIALVGACWLATRVAGEMSKDSEHEPREIPRCAARSARHRDHSANEVRRKAG